MKLKTTAMKFVRWLTLWLCTNGWHVWTSRHLYSEGKFLYRVGTCNICGKQMLDKEVVDFMDNIFPL